MPQNPEWQFNLEFCTKPTYHTNENIMWHFEIWKIFKEPKNPTGSRKQEWVHHSQVDGEVKSHDDNYEVAERATNPDGKRQKVPEGMSSKKKVELMGYHIYRKSHWNIFYRAVKNM